MSAKCEYGVKVQTIQHQYNILFGKKSKACVVNITKEKIKKLKE